MKTKDYEKIRDTLHDLRKGLQRLEQEATPLDEDYWVAHDIDNILWDTANRVFRRWCRYGEADFSEGGE